MRKQKTAGRRKSLSRFFSYLSPYWGLFLTGFAAMSLATVARLAGPLILRALVDQAIPAKDTAGMIRYALDRKSVV